MRASVVCCSALLLTSSVSAQQLEERRAPAARLELVRTADAAQCPDEVALRGAVARRLGRDPFSETSPRRARLTFSAEGAGLSLSIELVASDGTTLGHRVIRSRTRDCAELGESAAVALLVAMDVLEASAVREPTRAISHDRTPTQEPPTNVAPTRAQPRSTTALPAAERRVASPIEPRAATADSLAGYLAINAVGSAGDLPLVAFGGALRFGVRWRSLGVFLEGRAVLPTVIDGPQGSRIESSLYTGSALPCFHRAWFSACGVASVGALLARGSNVDRPREPTIAVFALGARASGSWRIPGDFFIDASAELMGALLRPSLTINAERAWDAPPLQGSLRVGVGVELR